jgi:ribosomal protein S18 acetylase RimI-like enzyme
LNEHEGEKAIFVMDIQIDPQHRRKGYGTEAFLLLEEKAREKVINIISLHIFRDNTSAQAMYKKLGYSDPNDSMIKRI